MSEFLPESSPSSSSIVTPTSGSSDVQITASDIALMQRVLGAAAQNVNQIPSSFMAYMLDYIQSNNLQIPIGQVFGFRATQAQAATGAGGSGTASAHATVTGSGPSLLALGSGQYVVLLSADLSAQFSGEPIVSFATLSGPSMTVQGGPTTGSFCKATLWTNSAVSADITTQWKADNSANASGFTYGISSLSLIALKIG